MARPLDEQTPYPPASSLASQTSLDGPDEEYGLSWVSKRGQKRPRPRLPKIKSSPSHGALAVARKEHETLHKRVNSASATPTSPTFVPDYLLQSSGSAIPASAHSGSYSSPTEKKAAKTKVKIKPLLQKLSSQEKINTIDLSRSAAENEGIGVYESSHSAAPARTPSRSTRRGFHHRTTSGQSQISIATTSSNRYGNTQYVHPMRQIPRPYTPPIATSYKPSPESETTPTASVHDSETSPTSYGPLPPAPRRNITAPPPLHIRTSSSFTHNSSQTNLPGTPSSLRFPTDPETMVSPATGRSSLESAFRRTGRSRSNTAQTDPAQQAASVQALRQKFQEKEAAKDKKYAEAEFRAAERERRRRERREEGERKEEEKRERKRAKSNVAASEKSSIVGYGSREERGGSQQPRDGGKVFEQPPRLYRKEQKEDRGHSQWTLFWVRFKTMWARFKRRMGGKGAR